MVAYLFTFCESAITSTVIHIFQFFIFAGRIGHAGTIIQKRYEFHAGDRLINDKCKLQNPAWNDSFAYPVASALETEKSFSEEWTSKTCTDLRCLLSHKQDLVTASLSKVSKDSRGITTARLISPKFIHDKLK